MFNSVTVVGVGLISGSLALALKEKNLAKHIIGVSRTESSAKKALELGLIDEALPLKEAVSKSDFIYVAIPVDVTIPVMQEIMDMITDKQIVADAGSTKFVLSETLKHHPMRSRFVSTHPMWGTEYSGPEAAVHCIPFPTSGVWIQICSASDDALMFRSEQIWLIPRRQRSACRLSCP